MMEVLKKVKRKLSVVLAAAMVVTSITIPNATVVKAEQQPQSRVTIQDVIQSVAGYDFWGDESTIVVDRSQSISDNIAISVKRGPYTVSVNGMEKFVSGNGVDTKDVPTQLNTDNFSEQKDTFTVTAIDGEGNSVLNKELTVLLKAKKVEVAELKATTPEAGTISVTGKIVDYVKYEGTKPTVKYQIDNNYAKKVTVSPDGVFSFKESGLTSGDHDVSVEIHSGNSQYSNLTTKSLKVSVPGKQEKVPDITVQFKSLDGKIVSGTTVPFNDINVVVYAENVPEGEKVTLEVPKWCASSGEALQYLIKKQLVVSGNTVNATERIQMPEDALGKEIHAEAYIGEKEDTEEEGPIYQSAYSTAWVKVREKPTFEVTDGENPVLPHELYNYYPVDYDKDYTIKVWDSVEKEYAEFSIVDKDRITVSENGLVANFKAKEEDAGKTLSYMVKSTVDGNEGELGRFYFRVTPAYTIKDISAKKDLYTVSNIEKVEGTHKAGNVIEGGIVITAKEGYVLSEVNVNGRKLNERLVKSFTITNPKDKKDFVVDKDYEINVKTVASVANKAEITISKKVNENEYVPLKNDATINCGDKIKIEAYKDGTPLDVSENLVVMHKVGSKYEVFTNPGLTIKEDGTVKIQNNVEGEQLQLVIPSKDGKIKYATYNFKVSKLAEKILVNKKATETINAEQANVRECQLTADGYINFSVANKEYLKEKHIIADVIDNKTLRIEVYPEAKAETYEITVSGNNASGSKIVDVKTAKVELTVNEPAWKEAEITLAPSTKYTSYQTIGFVPTVDNKKFKNLKAGNNFLSKYTFKWYYEMLDDKGKDIELNEHYSEKNDIKVEPKVALDSTKSYTIKAKLRLVKNGSKPEEVIIESNKASEASFKVLDNKKTEKIGFKKKSSAAYTEHAVELATLTYDKNTGRTLSDYYAVRLYDQNGDRVAITDKPNNIGDIDDMYESDNDNKMGAWLEDGSLVVYAPSIFAGQKFTAEVYAADKEDKDADVLAKMSFTVKRSIEEISGKVEVFKKENKALKVSLKPVFNDGEKAKAPASKKVSYALPADAPEGVTLKGNTLTIDKNYTNNGNEKIKVKITAADVKDFYGKNKSFNTVTVNVRTAPTDAKAIYIVKFNEKYMLEVVTGDLKINEKYYVILAKKAGYNAYDGSDVVGDSDYSVTVSDKKVIEPPVSAIILPVKAKKNLKFTATTYDGKKFTITKNIVTDTPDDNKIGFRYNNKPVTDSIKVSTNNIAALNIKATYGGVYDPDLLNKYNLSVKTSGLKGSAGKYIMTGKTASIKVMYGRVLKKELKITNTEYDNLKKAKAPSLKADKKFTVITATNSTNANESLNDVKITNKNYVSGNQVKAVVAYADQKTENTYTDVKSNVVGEHSVVDGSFVLKLGKKVLPAGNMKLNVYYVNAEGIPVTNAKAITIPVQKMKYSFKLSSGIKFGKEAVSTNVVARYDSNAVQSVDKVEVQNAFKKGTGKYNTFAEIFDASAFDMTNKSFALNITDGKAGTLSDILSNKDKDRKANKNGVIKVKVTYKDGAVRYYTTNVTVSQAKK